VSAGLKAVIAAEAQITKYDEVVGDGDCGITFKRGSEGKQQLILMSLEEPSVNIIYQLCFL